MYEQTGCFDPNSIPEGADDGFSQTIPNSHNDSEENMKISMEELSYQHHQTHPNVDASAAVAAAMEMELQQHLAFNMANSYNGNTNNPHILNQIIQDSTDQVLSYEQSNWESSGIHETQDVGFNPQHHHHQLQEQQLQQTFNIPSSLTETAYPATAAPDLLDLFRLPRCPAATNDTAASGSSVFYDPLFHLNFAPQPPLLRDLFQSLPQGYNLPGTRFGGEGDNQREDVEGVGSHFDNGILEFTRDMACIGKGRDANGKITKHFASERQRREHLNDKYKALRSLIPNPTKTDRASIVGDAIEYIKELLRTVNELKILVERKRCGRERSKRHKTEEDAAGGDVESSNMKPVGEADQSYNGSLRSSWLQRKSKDTEVDVRIIDDEVTIKLVQRKINCLLFVSKVLDELQLDLHHVAGGHIGDYYSYLFNTKIHEGSSVYASAIANKLIEVVDRHYATIPTTSGY